MLSKVRREIRRQYLGALALFVALGGTAAAQVVISSNDQVGDNVINSRNIVDGSIQAVDLAAGSVGTAKLKKGAVTNAILADHAVTAGKLGHIGTLAEGFSVPGGVANNGHWFTRSHTTSCVGGSVVLAGGVDWSAPAQDDEALAVTESYPMLTNLGAPAPGWTGRAANDSGVDRNGVVTVSCLTP